MFLGWRRSVPCFSDHKRRNVFYQQKDWTFRARPPSIRLCVCLLFCCWLASDNLLLLPSLWALSRSAASKSPPLVTSPVHTDEWRFRVIFPRKLWLLIKSNNTASLMVHLLRIWEQPHVSWRVMSSNLEGIEQAKCCICLKCYPTETLLCGSTLLP